MIVLEWELMVDGDGSTMEPVTERARVHGGWLVRCRMPGGLVDSGVLALTFVPDRHEEWDGD